jgi:hypothetical protein
VAKPRSPHYREQAKLPASPNHDVEYTDAETEFIVAMDKFKRERDRPFPTWCEVLAVLKSLGYKK